MGENLLKEGAATFYIVDSKLEHRDDDSFILWLKSEGYRLQSVGHPTADHCLYVNVASKVYNWGMAGILLSPILFDHAIHIDEFMTIYEIFKKYDQFPPGYYTMEQYRKAFGNDDSYLRYV